MRKGGTDRDGLLEINEGGAKFVLGGWGYYIAHDFGDREDRPIESGVSSGRQEGIQVPVTKKLLATHTAAGLWFWEIGGITVNVMHHISGMITYGGVRVWGRVFEEPKCFFISSPVALDFWEAMDPRATSIVR